MGYLGKRKSSRFKKKKILPAFILLLTFQVALFNFHFREFPLVLMKAQGRNQSWDSRKKVPAEGRGMKIVGAAAWRHQLALNANLWGFLINSSPRQDKLDQLNLGPCRYPRKILSFCGRCSRTSQHMTNAYFQDNLPQIPLDLLFSWWVIKNTGFI